MYSSNAISRKNENTAATLRETTTQRKCSTGFPVTCDCRGEPINTTKKKTTKQSSKNNRQSFFLLHNRRYTIESKQNLIYLIFILFFLKKENAPPTIKKIINHSLSFSPSLTEIETNHRNLRACLLL